MSLSKKNNVTHDYSDQEPKISFDAEPAGPQNFLLFCFFGDENGQKVFLRVFVQKKKI